MIKHKSEVAEPAVGESVDARLKKRAEDLMAEVQRVMDLLQHHLASSNLRDGVDQTVQKRIANESGLNGQNGVEPMAYM